MLATDLPYLEPLLFWLRKDADLMKEFTEKSFFMPHNDLYTAVMEAINNDCPAPRALWILPQQTIAQSAPKDCVGPGRHSFYIQVIVQCIRDQFQIVKREDGIHLTGQFMELSRLRNTIKKSVTKFAKRQKELSVTKFDGIKWVGDNMLYPESEGGNKSFLITNIEYEVTINV